MEGEFWKQLKQSPKVEAIEALGFTIPKKITGVETASNTEITQRFLGATEDEQLVFRVAEYGLATRNLDLSDPNIEADRAEVADFLEFSLLKVIAVDLLAQQYKYSPYRNTVPEMGYIADCMAKLGLDEYQQADRSQVIELCESMHQELMNNAKNEFMKPAVKGKGILISGPSGVGKTYLRDSLKKKGYAAWWEEEGYNSMGKQVEWLDNNYGMTYDLVLTPGTVGEEKYYQVQHDLLHRHMYGTPDKTKLHNAGRPLLDLRPSLVPADKEHLDRIIYTLSPKERLLGYAAVGVDREFERLKEQQNQHLQTHAFGAPDYPVIIGGMDRVVEYVLASAGVTEVPESIHRLLQLMPYQPAAKLILTPTPETHARFIAADAGGKDKRTQNRASLPAALAIYEREAQREGVVAIDPLDSEALAVFFNKHLRKFSDLTDDEKLNLLRYVDDNVRVADTAINNLRQGQYGNPDKEWLNYMLAYSRIAQLDKSILLGLAEMHKDFNTAMRTLGTHALNRVGAMLELRGGEKLLNSPEEITEFDARYGLGGQLAGLLQQATLNAKEIAYAHAGIFTEAGSMLRKDYDPKLHGDAFAFRNRWNSFDKLIAEQVRQYTEAVAGLDSAYVTKLGVEHIKMTGLFFSLFYPVTMPNNRWRLEFVAAGTLTKRSIQKLKELVKVVEKYGDPQANKFLRTASKCILPMTVDFLTKLELLPDDNITDLRGAAAEIVND